MWNFSAEAREVTHDQSIHRRTLLSYLITYLLTPTCRIACLFAYQIRLGCPAVFSEIHQALKDHFQHELL